MVWLLTRDALLLASALLGLGAPWLVGLKNWPPLERLSLAVGAALLTGWILGFGVYLAGLPLRWFWVAPAIGLLLAVARPAPLLALWRGPGIRGTLARLGLLSLWCLGWQVLVVNYSGAGWQGDWYEHYDRAHFFLDGWPRDFLFLNVYPLTARPPLVNVWSALLLSLAGGAFHHHQVFMTLLSCLVLLPLGALVDRWSRARATPWLLLGILMANPLVVQNATFPWTKLTAAFFVLVAWSQLTGPAAPGRLFAAALALAGGMLAHYSTGVWIVALGLGWLIGQGARLREPGLRRELLLAALAATAVMATWTGWAILQYGAGTTFTQNTALALGPPLTGAGRLQVTLINLLHTLSPVSLVGLDHPLLTQTSGLGRLRDGWFILYQLRLWWAFGVAGGLVLVWGLRRVPPSPLRRVVWIVVPAVIVLNAATHATPDRLGLAHISLQPLVLLGLGWIAARADALPRWAARLYGCGLAVDLLMGLALHFALQAGWPGGHPPGPGTIWQTYPVPAQVNWQDKLALGLSFLSDRYPWWTGVLLLLGTGGLAWRGWRSASTCIPQTDLSSVPPAP